MSVKPHQFVAHYRSEDGAIQDVWSHLENVGKLTAAIGAKIGMARVGEVLGLVHDLGKASSAFDSYIRHAVGLPVLFSDSGVPKGTVDHSTAGSQWLYRQFHQGKKPDVVAQLLALIVASHHSGLIDCLTVDGDNEFARRLHKPESQSHLNESLENAPAAYIRRINSLVSDVRFTSELEESIRSLKEPADTRSELAFKLGLLVRFLFSALVDGDRIDTIDFHNENDSSIRRDGDYSSWDTMIDVFEEHLRGFPCQNKIDDYRNAVSERCLKAALKERGIYRLTVPTGGGKTLASFRFALHHARHHRLERIIYVIPYTSIIDQNAAVIRDVIESNPDCLGMVLEHHSNLDPEIQSSPEQALYTQNWDAPIVLTTMVQFLEALFGSGTTRVRRMHQMANSVIVFDEIQNLPIRCVHMFNVALRYLVNNCRSTAILCTATQPLLHRVEPKSRALPDSSETEITPNLDSLFAQFKRVNVHDHAKNDPLTPEQLAEKVIEQAETRRSVLVILNTKRDARQVYRLLLNKTAIPVKHLSTNMCPAHRLEVLTEVRKALATRDTVICVSTQLVEAGVDLDFDAVFRALAGLDSLQQAAGRCNRHGRNTLGDVFFFRLAGENLSRLPEIRTGQEVALRVLDEFRECPDRFDYDLLSPKTMDRYYFYYFYNRRNEMDYPVHERTPVGRHDSLYQLLSTNDIAVQAHHRKYGPPNMLLCQSFSTAAEAFKVIEESGRGILVPYGQDGEELIADLCALDPWDSPAKLMTRAQQYSVNCFPYVLDSLNRQGALHRIRDDLEVYYVEKAYYHDDIGLVDEPNQSMKTLMA